MTEQPKKLPRGLSASIGRDIQTELEQFRDGASDRQEIITRIHDRIDAAMNTVAAREGYHPNAQKLTPEIVRATCRTWFRELGETFWTVEENMPKAARKPWADYCHYRNNPSPNSEAGKAQAAKDFMAATGFNAEEVFKFQCSLDKKQR